MCWFSTYREAVWPCFLKWRKRCMRHLMCLWYERDASDEIVCPAMSKPFHALSLWQDDMQQAAVEEVQSLLQKAWYGTQTRLVKCPRPVRRACKKVQRTRELAKRRIKAMEIRQMAIKDRKDQLAIDRLRKVQSTLLQSPLPLKIMGITRCKGKVSIMP